MRPGSLLIGGLLSGAIWSVNAQAAAPSTEATVATPRVQSAVSSARQNTSPLERHVTLDVQNVTLASALDEIARQVQLDLSFTDEVVPPSRRITIKISDMTARDALKRVLRGTGTTLEVTQGGSAMIVKHGSTNAKRASLADTTLYGEIWGKITDSTTGLPLDGVSVSITDSAVNSLGVNDARGFFVLPAVPVGVHTIHVRHMGYAPQQKDIVVTKGERARVDFALLMGMSRLQEVVTTASGQKRRLELGNDITVINADSIVASQPISTLTDLLEGRVPGLLVQRTSGAPGAPARLRLRGSSSAYLNNDPIVIVDGVRIYAAQSDVRNSFQFSGPTPSPLDYLDPHNIETVEVMKGPSASTLYGADAANGVIVITTKKGKAGSARWTSSVEHQISKLPGTYPDMYLRLGHLYRNDVTIQCPLAGTPTAEGCEADSLVSFQALNDPELTVLGQGNRTAATLGVSGGSDALQYSVNGIYSNELGLLRLPSLEVQRYQTIHGASPPDWMQRPQRLTQWDVSSRLTAKLGATADVSLTTLLSRSTQQNSTLQNALMQLMGTYVDRSTGRYYRTFPSSTTTSTLQPVNEILSNYYTRQTDDATQFTNGANLNWHPRSWLTMSADGGLNIIQREDAGLLPRGAAILSSDSIGFVQEGRVGTFLSTVNLRATMTAPLPWGFHLQTSVGANYTGQRTADLSASGNNLTVGGTSISQAGHLMGAVESKTSLATFGYYVEPSISSKRFWLSTGLRLDGGNAFGSSARLIGLPKVSASWLISDERFFPLKNVFDLFRIRAAYGHAGVQPGPGDRLRLFSTPTSSWLDGQYIDVVTLQTLGNTQLRPERSREFEGGFDADLLKDRLSIGVTKYGKTRVDALMQVPLPPSVYGGGSLLKNIGEIQNSGYELTLGSQLVRTDPVTFGAQIQLSHNQNRVVSLGPGVSPFFDPSGGGGRVAAGYPIFGRWGVPVRAYSDANHDGMIETGEVLYGDSAVYLGPQEPTYTAGLSTTLALFRSAVVLSANFTYSGGMAQVGPWSSLLGVSRAVNDPSAPLSDQAIVLSPTTSAYLNTQVVDAWRFNSLSVAYNVPITFAQRMGARSLSIALQGTNLGLRSNYRGKDPGVNVFAGGNGVGDYGTLPQPRTWQLRVNAGY